MYIAKSTHKTGIHWLEQVTEQYTLKDSVLAIVHKTFKDNLVNTNCTK